MTRAASAAVSAEGLTQSFERRTVIDRLSFEVAENEFLSIVGPSGCGKSTTLRILAGLVPPTSGTVRARGREVSGPLPDAAMVFQSPVLLPWRRTVSNILFTAEMAGKDGGAYRGRAEELVRLAGLDGFERSYPHELSGGMQQRVSICRALLLDPALLLMDEPFGALDVLTRESMGFELQRIWSKTRNTVVFVTHSIHEAVWLSDRVLVMTARPGRVKGLVPVDLPRPRSSSTMKDPRFVELTASVRELVEAE
ncbi:MAG TPA: ABC transporter ATP-binding protein [Vicinamibacteria bacterium]